MQHKIMIFGLWMLCCDHCSMSLRIHKKTDSCHAKIKNPAPIWSHPPLPLAERGYCLSGNYSTMLSRIALFNMSVSNPTECIGYHDSDGTEKFISPSSNFAKYQFLNPPKSFRSFQFKVINVYRNMYEAYLDFRHRSSIVVNRSSNYEDLFVTLTNIGVGKQASDQMNRYKRFQKNIVGKTVNFYHLRAQVVHGEFEFQTRNNSILYSSAFLTYIQQNPKLDDRFFQYFGTHYVRKGLFGGYVDLMITPWDLVCEVPISIDLSAIAECIAWKLNKKFGLGPKLDPLEEDQEDQRACANISYWTLNDQDILPIVAGSDYDFQNAISIVVKYPTFVHNFDKRLIRGWLRTLFDAPGLIQATLDPICELFTHQPEMFIKCKQNLLEYLKNNEPLLPTTGDEEKRDECEKQAGRYLILDIVSNGMRPMMRGTCLASKNANGLCPLKIEDTDSNACGKFRISPCILWIFLFLALIYK